MSEIGARKMRRLLMVLAFAPLVTAIAPRVVLAQDAGSESLRWEYGAFADFGHLKDFNSPENHLFRNRGTTPRVDEVDVNMAAIYLRKKASEPSRWGVEATV